jgi:hypothetical protein
MQAILKLRRFLNVGALFKLAAAGGYGVSVFYARDSISSLPFPLIGLGVMLLSFFLRNRIFRLFYFWILYSILAYSVVTYHENDICILEECIGDELTSQLSLISTGVLCAAIDISSQKKFITQVPLNSISLDYKADETIRLRWV